MSAQCNSEELDAEEGRVSDTHHQGSLASDKYSVLDGKGRFDKNSYITLIPLISIHLGSNI